jgi:uncharacterized membrane protein
MSEVLAAFKAVMAGFFGVRSRKNAEQAPIKLRHIIVLGLVSAAALVVLMLVVARYLVMSGGG